MSANRIYQRFVEQRLVEALSDTPVVLIHGPRQCGKTTLARLVGDRRGYEYLSLDDDVLLDAAVTDPIGFVGGLPARAVIDEVQRAPGIFRALKAEVDRRREPGRFIITGSANMLLLPTLSDSLAGRMEILRLHPLSSCEIAGSPSRFMDALFSGNFGVGSRERLGTRLAEVVAAGGYPVALTRSTPHRRMAWYRDYVEAIVQRDVRDFSRIGALEVLPRLLALAAGQSARLVNISDIAAPFRLSRPTIRDYVTLLEHVFLLEQLPPWHSNRLSRLIKTPKLHMCDTGVACALLGLDAVALTRDRASLGRMLETFVYQELRRQASWRDAAPAFHHFRDKDGAEVDVVLDHGANGIAGVEIKASATVTAADFRGLRKLQAAAGGRFAAGVVLYDGEACASFGEALFAVPLRALWETS